MTRSQLTGTCPKCGAPAYVEMMRPKREVPLTIGYRCQPCSTPFILGLTGQQEISDTDDGRKGTPHRRTEVDLFASVKTVPVTKTETKKSKAQIGGAKGGRATALRKQFLLDEKDMMTSRARTMAGKQCSRAMNQRVGVNARMARVRSYKRAQPQKFWPLP